MLQVGGELHPDELAACLMSHRPPGLCACHPAGLWHADVLREQVLNIGMSSWWWRIDIKTWAPAGVICRGGKERKAELIMLPCSACSREDNRVAGDGRSPGDTGATSANPNQVSLCPYMAPAGFAVLDISFIILETLQGSCVDVLPYAVFSRLTNSSPQRRSCWV